MHQRVVTKWMSARRQQYEYSIRRYAIQYVLHFNVARVSTCVVV